MFLERNQNKQNYKELYIESSRDYQQFCELNKYAKQKKLKKINAQSVYFPVWIKGAPVYFQRNRSLSQRFTKRNFLPVTQGRKYGTSSE